MRFEIVFAPDAAEAIRRLDARTRAAVKDQIEIHLRHEPTKLSKSRIKRLRGVRQPQYRLRVGEMRVFYDVLDDEVQVLFAASKAEAMEWLREKGIPE